MKILHLISGGDTGGAKTHVLDLLRALSAGDEVRLLCLRDGAMAGEAAALGIPCTVLSGGFFSQMRQVGTLARQGWDLLHCHGSRADLTGALLRGRLGLPVLCTVHSDHRLDYLGRPLARLLYGTLCSLALGRVDGVVCVSEALRDKYRRRGLREERLFWLNNGADFDRPPAKADRRGWLLKNGCPPAWESAVLAGAAARFDPVKDLSTLLRGFALAENKKLRLILAGSGPEEKKLRALAASLGVSDRVAFPGWVEDTEGLYACLDINALTSLSETFPYALTDGARYALATVSTAVGGVPALIRDERDGLLIPAGDAGALAGALDRLAGDPALRKSLGESLYTRTRATFSLSAMAARQRAIYESLLKGRRGVVLSGACGLGNVGDEAMVTVLLKRLRQIDPLCAVTVLSRSPGETERLLSVKSVHSFHIFAVLRALSGAGLFISGGGNLLQDVTSRRSLSYYLWTLKAAKGQGCRVLLYGCGLGPLSPQGRRRTARTVSRCADAVAARDEGSLALFQSLCPDTRVSLGDEPALFLEALTGEALDALEKRLGLVPEGRYLAICPRKGPSACGEIMREAAAALCEKEGLTPVLFALDRRRDGPLCRQLSGGAPVIAEALTPAETAGLLGRMTLVLSQRLHGLVFAAMAGVPCVGLSWDGRVSAFMDRAGLLWLPERGLTAQALRDAGERALKQPPKDPVPRRDDILESFMR